MVWTDPNLVNWDVGDALTSADMKTYVRDNFLALRNPPSYSYLSSSNYTTTSTSFVNVDSTNMSHSFVLAEAGAVIVHFSAAVSNLGGGDVTVNIEQDGVSIQESQVRTPYAVRYPVIVTALIEALPAGTYVFRPRWKVSGSTGTIYGGTNSFFVREV